MLHTEFGGMNEVLTNLYQVTGNANHLAAAQHFDHAQIFDPLAANQDRLADFHANTQIPKITGAIREYHATGNTRYRDIAVNFWNIVTGAPQLRHRRQLQRRVLPAAQRDRQPAVGQHHRIVQLLQHAQADPAAVLHQPGAHGVPRLLREDVVQPHPRRAEPVVGARLPQLLHPAAPRRHQDLQQRLQQLDLLPRHRAWKATPCTRTPSTSTTTATRSTSTCSSPPSSTGRPGASPCGRTPPGPRRRPSRLTITGSGTFTLRVRIPVVVAGNAGARQRHAADAGYASITRTWASRRRRRHQPADGAEPGVHPGQRRGAGGQGRPDRARGSLRDQQPVSPCRP